MKASGFQSHRKLGREPGSSLGAQARCCGCRPILPCQLSGNPLGSPTLPGCLAVHCAAGMSSVSRMKSRLGELVSSMYKHTRKHTPYGCLNKVMLKKGDLCQQREMNLHATACGNMLSGKSWHIFCVQPCIHNGITRGAELLRNLRLWVFNST